MSEYHKLANLIKEMVKKEKESAVQNASASIGVIKSLNPLIITTYDGQIRYEDAEKEIIQSKTFSSARKEVGDKVIVIPVESIESIAVIDFIR